MKRLLIRLFRNEKLQGFTIPLCALALSLIAITVLILVIGKNPLDVFRSLLAGSGWIPKTNYAGGKSQLTDFVTMLDNLTPMLFAALAVTAALRCGLFNIGVSGQMLAAGFIATVLVGYSDMGAFIAKPLVLIIGAAVGALVGACIGWLKHQFNIHEVVSSIMLNNIVMYFVSYMIKSQYRDPVTQQSRVISSAARLVSAPVTIGGVTMQFPLGLPLALIAAVALMFLFTKTTVGLELTAVGKNPKAAQYYGIKVGRARIFAMILSGALAGLAGVTLYLGLLRSIVPSSLTSVGFDSIAVALLGNTHPLGVILSSILLTTLTNGATYMSSIVGVRQEIASLIVGLVLLFSACGGFIKLWIDRVSQTESLPYDDAQPPATPEEVLGNEGVVRT